jgi:hypothetical protein
MFYFFFFYFFFFFIKLSVQKNYLILYERIKNQNEKLEEQKKRLEWEEIVDERNIKKYVADSSLILMLLFIIYL